MNQFIHVHFSHSTTKQSGGLENVASCPPEVIHTITYCTPIWKGCLLQFNCSTRFEKQQLRFELWWKRPPMCALTAVQNAIKRTRTPGQCRYHPMTSESICPDIPETGANWYSHYQPTLDPGIRSTHIYHRGASVVSTSFVVRSSLENSADNIFFRRALQPTFISYVATAYGFP